MLVSKYMLVLALCLVLKCFIVERVGITSFYWSILLSFTLSVTYSLEDVAVNHILCDIATSPFRLHLMLQKR